jgi:hypothetical protein
MRRKNQNSTAKVADIFSIDTRQKVCYNLRGIKKKKKKHFAACMPYIEGLAAC